jgi:DDE domain
LYRFIPFCNKWPSWRLDGTYVRVKGAWKYLYRAVDKARATVDFLLTAKRDRKAALRFLRKAIGRHGVPEKITIDKSGANTAVIVSYTALDPCVFNALRKNAFFKLLAHRYLLLAVAVVRISAFALFCDAVCLDFIGSTLAVKTRRRGI